VGNGIGGRYQSKQDIAEMQRIIKEGVKGGQTMRLKSGEDSRIFFTGEVQKEEDLHQWVLAQASSNSKVGDQIDGS